jgi:hypothetical protein
LRIRVCRDKTLASETILYARVGGRDYYGWLDGSPAIGYRIHFSGSLFKDWWQVGRRGFYSRASHRRRPSETRGSVEPGSAVPTGTLDVVDFSRPGSPDSSRPGRCTERSERSSASLRAQMAALQDAREVPRVISGQLPAAMPGQLRPDEPLVLIRWLRQYGDRERVAYTGKDEPDAASVPNGDEAAPAGEIPRQDKEAATAEDQGTGQAAPGRPNPAETDLLPPQ